MESVASHDHLHSEGMWHLKKTTVNEARHRSSFSSDLRKRKEKTKFHNVRQYFDSMSPSYI